MIYNALAAVCVGGLLGLRQEEMKRGIEKIKALKGRSNVMKLPFGVLIDDCYNANPVSMKAALDLLQTAPHRKVAVLGDMFELGEHEVSMHEEIGRYALTNGNGTDVLICIGKLSLHMYMAAKDVGKDAVVCYFPDKQSFLEKAKDIIRTGDTVLLKASHGMAFDTLTEAFQTSSLFLK
jgi:UDP-N-acetylmuramoyl-tripeptide--D-alanyl-D-alanine ligase